MTDTASIIADDILALPRPAAGACVVGLCGAQGSGKSTTSQAVRAKLAEQGISSAILSLDDLYLSKTRRLTLAADVHPLLVTRGPPGTHDAGLGAELLARLKRGEAVQLPVFDKVADDRATDFRPASPAEVILFEGWCVGARPQPAGQLAEPVNALEREEDPHGVWRAFVNRSLIEDYPALFAPIDRLIMLCAPGFEVVARWRLEQETTNRAGRTSGRAMTSEQVDRFIRHYERLTRWMLDEVPARADLVIDLDAARNVVGQRKRGQA